jgi:hypothetical protein
LSVSNSSETRKLPTASNPSLACLVTEFLHFRDRFCPLVFKTFLVVSPSYIGEWLPKSLFGVRFNRCYRSYENVCPQNHPYASTVSRINRLKMQRVGGVLPTYIHAGKTGRTLACKPNAISTYG